MFMNYKMIKLAHVQYVYLSLPRIIQSGSPLPPPTVLTVLVLQIVQVLQNYKKWTLKNHQQFTAYPPVVAVELLQPKKPKWA